MEIPTFVKGNPFSLSIPLQRQNIEASDEGVKRVVNDFFPGSGQPVSVVLQKGAHRELEVASMEGNFAVVNFFATLDPGLYALEILCSDSDGRPRRYKKAEAIEIVDESIKAGLDVNVEFDDSPYLMPAAIFPGVVTYNAGESTVKKAKEVRPIVHRAVPERPQPGSMYYFEREVRLKFKTMTAMIEALEAMDQLEASHAMVFAGGKHVKFGSIEELRDKAEEIGLYSHAQLCLATADASCQLVVCDEKHILNDDGTIDYGRLLDGITARRTSAKITAETRSPNFRVENGQVICIAECTKEYVNGTMQRLGIKRGLTLAARLADGLAAITLHQRVKSNRIVFSILHRYGPEGEDAPLEQVYRVGQGLRIRKGKEAPPAPGEIVSTDPVYGRNDMYTLVGRITRFLGERREKGENQEWKGYQEYEFEVFGWALNNKHADTRELIASAYPTEMTDSFSDPLMVNGFDFQDRLNKADKKLFITRRFRWTGKAHSYKRIRMTNYSLGRNAGVFLREGPFRIHRIVGKKYKSVRYYVTTIAYSRYGLLIAK